MSKIVKEDCKTISIYQLKKWGYLKNNYSSGSLIWTRKSDGEENKVDFILDLTGRYFELNYRIRQGQEKWKSVKQRYEIVSTPCNYGGIRYWFICSIYNRNIYCGRRVAKLYLGDNGYYFACRHCYNLSYEKRNENNKGRYGYLVKFFNLKTEIKELEKKTKIYFRKGKPTKNYRRLLHKENVLDNVSERASDLLDKF